MDEELTPEISQDEYADDFFESGDYVSQDDVAPAPSEPVAPSQPAPPQQPNPNQGQTQPINQPPLPNQDDPNQQLPDQGVQNPPPAEPNQFDFQKVNEQGESVFDADTAYKTIFSHDNVLKPAYQQAPIQQPVQPAQQLPGQPPVQPELDYRDTYSSNLKSFYTIFKQFSDKGYDNATSEMLANEQFERHISSHMNEKLNSEERDRNEVWRKEQEEKLFVANARPSSSKNIGNMVHQNKWGSASQLESAILQGDIGGDLFGYLHHLQDPGKTYNSKEEYSASLQDFYIKATSDPQGLAVLEKYARAMLFLKTKDKFQGHSANIQNTQQKLKQQATKRNGGYTRTNYRPPAQQDSVGKWADGLT